jgi:hypothetical protein
MTIPSNRATPRQAPGAALLAAQEPLGAPFDQILDDNLWALYERSDTGTNLDEELK